MVKSNGFTLIELLAVIVVLAVIALIATPIVLGIVDDARSNASEIAAGQIVEGVETAYYAAYLNGKLPTLEEVVAKFNMKSATMTITEGGSAVIKTEDSGINCAVSIDANSFYVTCTANSKAFTTNTLQLKAS